MANRFTSFHGDRIEYAAWLIFDRAGGLRLTRAEPGVAADERAMSVSITLPKSLFATPSLRATIKVDGPTTTPIAIDVTAAAEALRQAIGCAVDVQVNDAPPAA